MKLLRPHERAVSLCKRASKRPKDLPLRSNDSCLSNDFFKLEMLLLTRFKSWNETWRHPWWFRFQLPDPLTWGCVFSKISKFHGWAFYNFNFCHSDNDQDLIRFRLVTVNSLFFMSDDDNTWNESNEEEDTLPGLAGIGCGCRNKLPPSSVTHRWHGRGCVIYCRGLEAALNWNLSGGHTMCQMFKNVKNKVF